MFLFFLIQLCLISINARLIAHGMTSEQRRALIVDIFKNKVTQEPDLFKRRRLGQKTDRLPNSKDLHDHYNYHYDVSVQSNLLRAFGFDANDGVPSSHNATSQLTHGFLLASRDLALYHINVQSINDRKEISFHINTNGVSTESIPSHIPIHESSMTTHSRHLFHIPGVTDYEPIKNINDCFLFEMEHECMERKLHIQNLDQKEEAADKKLTTKRQLLSKRSTLNVNELNQVLMKAQNANKFLARRKLKHDGYHNGCGEWTAKVICEGHEWTWEQANAVTEAAAAAKKKLEDAAAAAKELAEDGVDLLEDGVDLLEEGVDKVKDFGNAVLDGIKSLGDDGRGNYKNECVETKVVPEGAIQFKIPSKCSLEAVSVYHVIPLGEDVISPMPTAPVNEGAKTSNGETCICEGSDACPSGVHKSGGVPHDDIGIVYQQWCKCQQTGETSLGGTVENYALLGPVCPSYPESGLDSYCMINNDEIAFPKIVSCKFSIVLMQGVDVTLETTVKLGFGGAGEDYALAADMYVGIATSKLPRSCWGADTVLEILPDPSDQDLMCRSLRFLSQTLNKIMDVGETLSAGKHTLDLYPFRFRWPNTYFPEGEGYLPGTGKIQSIMKHMARVPVQKPRYCSDFGGLCTNDANLNFMNGSVCLANIGEGFKRPGPKRNSFRYLSVVYGLLGGDR